MENLREKAEKKLLKMVADKRISKTKAAHRLGMHSNTIHHRFKYHDWRDEEISMILNEFDAKDESGFFPMDVIPKRCKLLKDITVTVLIYPKFANCIYTGCYDFAEKRWEFSGTIVEDEKDMCWCYYPDAREYFKNKK